MKLLTKEIREKLPKLRAQEHEKDPMVYVKFFSPVSSWTWWITEGEQEGDDFLMFGRVDGFESELGYVSLNELRSVKGPLGLGIERDLYFTPRRLSECKR